MRVPLEGEKLSQLNFELTAEGRCNSTLGGQHHRTAGGIEKPIHSDATGVHASGESGLSEHSSAHLDFDLKCEHTLDCDSIYIDAGIVLIQKIIE